MALLMRGYLDATKYSRCIICRANVAASRAITHRMKCLKMYRLHLDELGLVICPYSEVHVVPKHLLVDHLERRCDVVRQAVIKYSEDSDNYTGADLKAFITASVDDDSSLYSDHPTTSDDDNKDRKPSAEILEIEYPAKMLITESVRFAITGPPRDMTNNQDKYDRINDRSHEDVKPPTNPIPYCSAQNDPRKRNDSNQRLSWYEDRPGQADLRNPRSREFRNNGNLSF